MSIPNSQHQQYSVISAFAQALQKRLTGCLFKDAYTLSKEELVMVFSSLSNQTLTIKIIQQFRSCFVLVYDDEPSKGSNAQPCFESVFNQPIQKIEQHPSNRSFSMVFLPESQLVFKMYDGLVNVLLFEKGSVTDLFRDSIISDTERTLQSFYEGSVPTELPAQRFYIYERQHIHPYYLAISPQPDKVLLETDNVFEALTEFSKTCLAHYRFEALKQKLQSRYSAERKKLSVQLQKSRQILAEKQQAVTAEEIANILMANMHGIPSQISEIELFDFYHNTPIVIQLKKELSAQQNAAYYYRKHKNSTIEHQQLLQKITSTEEKLLNLDERISELERVKHLKELKPYLPKEKERTQSVSPFRVFEFDGFSIWVGKSAANNDELTMRHSHKNDLWLHAKDVTGSHVLVKWKPGKPFSANVIERAAQLAAYYSKLKGSSLVPVSYTLKKFVRKPKGAQPGQVVIEKEEVVMVQPILY